MTSVSTPRTTRRSAILLMVSKITRLTALVAVIILSGFVLVSAEGYFKPEHVARIFASPPMPAFGP